MKPSQTRPRRPTKIMLQVLAWMNEGKGTHYQCHGLSQHGGRSRILIGLMDRELIDRDYKITDKGRLMLTEQPQ